MASDLCEVVFLEGEAQRLHKLKDFIGGLIGKIRRKGKVELVIFHIVANSFLPHQVRNTIGLLLRLGLGKITVDDFCDIMEAKNPGLAAPTAPACGLWLTNVNYAKPLGDDGT